MKPPRITVQFEELGDPAPNGRNSTPFGEVDKATGEVTLDPRQSESELLDSAVHEFLHVACPRMSEGSVHRTASVIATALWKMGYRRK